MGDGKSGVRNAKQLGNLRGSTVKLDCRASTAVANHFYFQPIHSLAYAGSEGLRGCLLGGKPRRETLSGVALAQAVGLFRRGINAVEKSLPITIHRLLDAPNFRQVDS